MRRNTNQSRNTISEANRGNRNDRYPQNSGRKSQQDYDQYNNDDDDNNHNSAYDEGYHRGYNDAIGSRFNDRSEQHDGYQTHDDDDDYEDDNDTYNNYDDDNDDYFDNNENDYDNRQQNYGRVSGDRSGWQSHQNSDSRYNSGTNRNSNSNNSNRNRNYQGGNFGNSAERYTSSNFQTGNKGHQRTNQTSDSDRGYAGMNDDQNSRIAKSNNSYAQRTRGRSGFGSRRS